MTTLDNERRAEDNSGMRVFLSYAHEQRPIAEKLAVRLEAEGHRVFFDSMDLEPGDAFDARIRSGIERAGLFIFLVTPQSVEAKSYALTELGFAKKRWRRPEGRILPVILEPVSQSSMPEFGGTYLTPKGDIVAEVLAEVERIAKSRTRRRLVMTAWAAGALAAAVIAVLLFFNSQKPIPDTSCRLVAEFHPSPSRSATMPEGLTLHVSRGGVTHDFHVENDGTCRFEIDAGPADEWIVDFTSARGVAWGRSGLRGCPIATTKVTLDEGSSLTIRPQ